jgi:Inorganic pyrophosphatase
VISWQTWEDPTKAHAETEAKGDNDPLDDCEIGETVGYVGQVKQVKVLGIMALLEVDAIVDVQDPLAWKLNDIEDVEKHLPGLIRATNEWFRCVLFSCLQPLFVVLTPILASTKFPTASQKTVSPSLARPRTRNMPLKLLMSVTKLGAVSFSVRAKDISMYVSMCLICEFTY